MLKVNLTFKFDFKIFHKDNRKKEWISCKLILKTPYQDLKQMQWTS